MPRKKTPAAVNVVAGETEAVAVAAPYEPAAGHWVAQVRTYGDLTGPNGVRIGLFTTRDDAAKWGAEQLDEVEKIHYSVPVLTLAFEPVVLHLDPALIARVQAEHRKAATARRSAARNAARRTERAAASKAAGRRTTRRPIEQPGR